MHEGCPAWDGRTFRQRLPTALAVCVGWTVLFAALEVPAVMPPHVARVEPADGVLTDGRIELHGYTLDPPGPGELVVIDEATGEAAPFTTEFSCHGEGDPDGPPGAYQSRCVIVVHLGAPGPGHRYAVTFLGNTYRFAASKHELERDSGSAGHAARVLSLLDDLLAHAKPDPAAVAAVLGVSFSLEQAGKAWRTLEASTAPPPFRSVELRLARGEERGLLVLALAAEYRLEQRALDTSDWGEPRLQVNPDIPPEGVVGHVYQIGPVALTLQFTARSHLLRQAVLEWGGGR